MRTRLHILSVPFTITRDEFSHDAYAGKVKRFAPMMRSRGFEVYHYGVETSESGADKEIQLLSVAEWADLRIQSFRHVEPGLTLEEATRKHHDPKQLIGVLWDVSTPLIVEFNKRLRDALRVHYRGKSTDIVCLPHSITHDSALQGRDYTVIESGIGYEALSSHSVGRVFESHTWMSFILGSQNRVPHNYWYVIPNYFDIQEFQLSLKPEPRRVGFLGRIGDGKGCNIIVEIAKQFPDVQFVICGAGDASPYLTLPNITYKAPIHGKERSDYLGSCAAVLCPSAFLEPFCGVAVEAQLCGTPVICSDWGGMTETVEPTKTGMLCHTLADYCQGIRMALQGVFDRAYIRNRAVDMFDMYKLAFKYENVFNSVLDIYNGKGGWYSPDCHTNHLSVDMIYYINLDRRPDRNANMLRQFAAAGIPTTKIKRIVAIDGATHAFSEAELALFKKADFMSIDALKPYAAKIMGNQLSHFSIYKDVITNGFSKVLILQDDAVFRTGFLSEFNSVCESLPSDCEVLNIGIHEAANLSYFVGYNLDSATEYMGVEESRINDYVCKWKHSMQPCSLAYILTQEGAQRLIEHFEPRGFPYATDISLNEYLIQKDVFYGSRKILCTGDPSFGSDIFI